MQDSILLLVRTLGGNSLVRHAEICGDDGRDCLEGAKNLWQHQIDAAEAAYVRSSARQFTAFIGWALPECWRRSAYRKRI